MSDLENYDDLELPDGWGGRGLREHVVPMKGAPRTATWAKLNNGKKKAPKVPLTAEQKEERRLKRVARAEKTKKALAEYQQKIRDMNDEEKEEFLLEKAKKKKHSGLVFSHLSVSERMKRALGYIRFTRESTIFTAAILEYMTAELLELAGNVCKEKKRTNRSTGEVTYARKRIIPRDIMLAIRNDDEIEKLVGKNRVILPSVGTVVKTFHVLKQPKAGALPNRYWHEMGMTQAKNGANEPVDKEDFYHIKQEKPVTTQKKKEKKANGKGKKTADQLGRGKRDREEVKYEEETY